MEPQRRLMLAVLQTAVHDWGEGLADRRGGRRTREGERALTEAMAWVASRDQSWPFSFENVCAALGLDPASVRQGLVRAADAEVEFSPS